MTPESPWLLRTFQFALSFLCKLLRPSVNLYTGFFVWSNMMTLVFPPLRPLPVMLFGWEPPPSPMVVTGGMHGRWLRVRGKVCGNQVRLEAGR